MYLKNISISTLVISYSLAILAVKFKLINSNKFINTNVIREINKLELELIGSIEYFLEYNQLCLAAIKIILDENKQAHGRVSENYFLNPINTYSFTRRLAYWNDIEDYVLNKTFSNKIKEFTGSLNLPTMDSIFNTVHTFFWLQDAYKLLTSDLSRGLINGIQYNTSLNTEDCFNLGHVAYNQNDLYHSILWMNETFNKFDKETKSKKLRITLEILTESYYKLGNSEKTIYYMNQIKKFYPDIDTATMLNNYRIQPNDIHRFNIIFNSYNQRYDKLMYDSKKYTTLCREEQQINTKKTNRLLFCHYINNNIPFLFIAPLKKEYLSYDPMLVMFHDVIYDEEIVKIKEIIKSNLTKSAVRMCEIKRFIRASKDAYIDTRYKDKVIFDIMKRGGDITTLNINSAQSLHVNYYEIANHYGPHLDNSQDKAATNELQRMSTLMFYLNNVEQGGATVFTKLNITVWPKKGSAIFWHNLFSSGQVDYRTRHAGCPILVGNKWAVTIWYLEKNQEFYRPCVESSRIRE